jgi:hypothetical protein
MRHRAADEVKPRASMPATLSILLPAHGCTSSSTARRNERASPSSVVMSRNRMPGFGYPEWCGRRP